MDEIKPSNPVRFFKTPNKTAEFLFEPGAYPFYVRLRSKSYVAISCLVFADDEDHVRDILKRAIAFQREVYRSYKEFFENQQDHPQYYHRDSTTMNALHDALTNEDSKFTLTISKQSSLNQLYKVAWAENDNFG